ncbi:MAG: hypothetical protein GY950_21640 [bacterium]|nr:hypothetical protein [bacterium]
MKVSVSACENCGAPLPVTECQMVTECRYCKNKYYIHQELPPAVVLKPGLNAGKAKDIVLKELGDKEISPNFIQNSSFEQGVLYYIPFFEERGIRAGVASAPQGKNRGGEYSYLAYDSIEKTNDLTDLGLGERELHIVEDTMISADRVPYNPVEMRKTGVILSPQNLSLLTTEKKQQAETARISVEAYYRLLYFPVWEIRYSFQGIFFKSYVSGVDGRPLKVQGLRSHKKKLGMAMSGLLALAVILGRGLNAGGGGLVVSAIVGLPASAILFPYLWELFAFREIVEKRGDKVNFHSINYTENSFEKFSRKLVDGFINLLRGGKNNETRNQS